MGSLIKLIEFQALNNPSLSLGLAVSWKPPFLIGKEFYEDFSFIEGNNQLYSNKPSSRTCLKCKLPLLTQSLTDVVRIRIWSRLVAKSGQTEILEVLFWTGIFLNLAKTLNLYIQVLDWTWYFSKNSPFCKRGFRCCSISCFSTQTINVFLKQNPTK